MILRHNGEVIKQHGFNLSPEAMNEQTRKARRGKLIEADCACRGEGFAVLIGYARVDCRRHFEDWS